MLEWHGVKIDNCSAFLVSLQETTYSILCQVELMLPQSSLVTGEEMRRKRIRETITLLPTLARMSTTSAESDAANLR